MSINFSNYLKSGTLTVAAGGTGTTTSTGSGSVVLSTSPNITTPYFNTNYTVDATSIDDQPIFVTSNSTNITGLSYAPGDNRVLVVGIAPGKKVMVRTGSGTTLELRSAAVSISSTTTSTTTTSGALQVAGGVGIVENLNVGGSATITGNLTVNGTTTTINSSTVSVDDKNIELGAVTSGTISTTGTVGSITGTGPWTATITNMTTTANLITGVSISATAGTGTLYGGSPSSVVVASIVSSTSITYTVTGGTTPTAGTVTNITSTGNSDITANGAGITIKAAADKTLYWTFAENRWVSNIGFQANNPALGGTLGSQEISARFSSTYSGNVGLFDISHFRDAAGTDWTTVGTRLQQKIDATWMAWQQFNGNGNTGGIAWGTGQTNTSPQSIAEAMRLDSSGNLGIGTSSPSNWYSNAARLVVAKAQNAETILGIGNSTVGALAAVSLRMIGGTANSYSISALRDANGSPYYQDDLGLGVLYRNWTFNGVERVRLNNTGFYVYNSAMETRAVDTSTKIRSINSSSETPKWAGFDAFHYSGNLAGTADNGGFSVLELFRSRGTEATKLAVQTDDALGCLTGWGWDGIGMNDVARIYFTADNAFSAADARGRIDFQTQTGTTLSTAMTIKSTGNVGIGTTSPLEKLHVYTPAGTSQSIQDANSVIRFVNANGKNYIQSGNDHTSASAAPLLFTDIFAINEWMRITTTGNVGIGTTAPAVPLQVAGETRLTRFGVPTQYVSYTGDSTGNRLTGVSQSGNEKEFVISSDTNSDSLRLKTVAAKPIVFMTTDTERMRIDSSGNVGIGQSTPTAKLHVQNGTNAVLLEPTGTWAAKIYQANDATTYNGLVVGNRWAADTSTVFEAGSVYGQGAGTSWGSFYKISGIGTHTWGTSNSGIATRMVLDNTGKLGIGTSSPSALLHVRNASADTIIKSESGSGYAGFHAISSGTNNAYMFFGNATNGEQGRIAVSDTGIMVFAAGNSATERIRIDSAGNVGIGTSSPSEKLHVNGNLLLENNFAIKQKMANGTATNLIAIDSSNSFRVAGGYSTAVHIHPDATSDTYLHFNNSGSVVVGNNTTATNMYIQNGNLTIGNGTVNSGYKLQVNGSFAATTKSFVIDHPTKPDMKLRYGSLEGPENGVYVRGRLKDSNVIELPDYWTELVHEDTITVNLTAIGKSQDLWVEDIVDNTVIVGGDNINCFYTVFAERKDVEKLIVEF
jgi:hypothetical protein